VRGRPTFRICNNRLAALAGSLLICHVNRLNCGNRRSSDALYFNINLRQEFVFIPKKLQKLSAQTGITMVFASEG
jgi:hypothetical protein